LFSQRDRRDIYGLPRLGVAGNSLSGTDPQVVSDIVANYIERLGADPEVLQAAASAPAKISVTSGIWKSRLNPNAPDRGMPALWLDDNTAFSFDTKASNGSETPLLVLPECSKNSCFVVDEATEVPERHPIIMDATLGSARARKVFSPRTPQTNY
jgi:hypothetical protein